MIWGEDRANFAEEPERAFADRRICVTGIVSQYRGVPQIVVELPSAIRPDANGADPRSAEQMEFHRASLSSLRAAQCDASELCGLVGYTIVDCSNVTGDFEGADFDKPVALDNGMVFTFQTYSYTYSYRPEAVVFATSVTYEGRGYTLYKLLVEDELYDVTRVR